MQDGIPIPEAAAALGVSEKTVRRRIHDGTLTAYEIHTKYGPAWRVVLPAGDGDQEPGQAVSTVARAVDNDRLRVVVEELQRTRERVAALEALLPEHGPPDPGPPVEFGPREIIEDTVQSPRASPGILARLRAFFGG